MESGARTAPFIGSQYCLLHNPGLAGHQATDQIWNLDIQNFIEQVFSRREREVKWPDTVLVFRHHLVYGGSCYRRLPPLITHMSDVLLLPSSTTTIKFKSNYSTLIILLIWKTPMLRRQMAMSDEQTAVWVALKEQTGGKHMLTTQHQRWAKISTINISSLLWSGWFQNLVYTHCQWSLELVDLYIMFMVPRFSHFRYLHWFCSNFLHKVHNAAKHLGMNGK